jgi:polysaccharide deacetylase family protein (PEP-CTERM system associated)
MGCAPEWRSRRVSEDTMTSTNTERPGANQAVLSIDVEDWFHAENLKIAREAWDRCELRVERNTMRMMEILDQANARATFFVLGWVAEKCPQLVRAIAAAGHEVASHGYEHKLVYSLTPHEFRADVVRSKKHLEDLIGRAVRGYRAPCFSITDWAIPILQDAGFDYDSSVVPTFAHDRYGRLSGVSAAEPVVRLRDGFHEAGVSCIPIGTRGLPWGGGGYFRLVPFRLWCEGIRTILRTGRPYIFYIHPWEIDPGQPQVPLSIGRRFRHRVNLGRCEARFAALCEAFQWMPVCDLLDKRKVESREAAGAELGRSVVAAASDTRARPHVLCIGGDDHHLRIPFMLALRNEGFRVSAAGPGDSAPFARAGIDHHRFRLGRFVSPIADAMSLKAIRKIIADARPELVHCFDTKLNVLVPLASRACSDVQAISTVNGLGWLYSSRSAMALGLRPVYRTLQRKAARWTAATIFQNRDDQTFFARHRMLDTGRHLVIPGAGIDIKGFEAAATRGCSPCELRAALGLENAEVVVTVARMTREKGIPTLLAAAALVHERRPSVRFLLVGPRASEGPWAVTQAEIDRHAPYVIAIGPRSDVPALLRIADVFAFPTEYREGVPRAVLEAALTGVPIVATDLPGCRDVVHDGLTGLLVPPSSPAELAERILALLRDRTTARAMGARARELVRREFGLQLVTERHAAVYRELLGRSARCRVHLTDEAGMTIRSKAMPLEENAG